MRSHQIDIKIRDLSTSSSEARRGQEFLDGKCEENRGDKETTRNVNETENELPIILDHLYQRETATG